MSRPTTTYRPLDNQAGAGLVGFIIAAGASLVLLGGIMASIMQSQTYMQGVYSHDTLRTIRRSVEETLQNQTAWNHTVNAAANNGSTDCLRNSTCINGATGTLALFDASATQMIGRADTDGFDARGNPCTVFNALSGHDECPFKLALRWEAVCGSPCIQPQVRIYGAFQFKPTSHRFAFNANQHDFNLFRGGGSLGGQILRASTRVQIDSANNVGLSTVHFDAGNSGATTPSEVFTVQDVGGGWGATCRAPYVLCGCSMSDPGVPGRVWQEDADPSDDPPPPAPALAKDYDLSMRQNGCWSDGEERAARHWIWINCCRI